MDEKKLTVRAVERSLDILLCFTQKSHLGMMEIAQLTMLNKSTVFRLLRTLEEKGFVQRDMHTDKYFLGVRIWELAVNLDHSNDPAILFVNEMERLRDTFEETVSLYVQDGYERIRIQAVESRQTIRRIAPIGVRMPLSVGASSKVIMAFMDRSAREGVFKDKNWPISMNLQSFVMQLQKVIDEGYATSVEEREAGTAAIAVPIFNREGTFVAALAVSGPVSRLSSIRMVEMAPCIMSAAESMGKRLRI